MSKALRTVATIAGAVALVATGIGAAGGFGLGAKALATISTVGKIATVTSAVAGVGAQLTAPKPVARGSPAQLTIDIEPPRPYIVGQVMAGGVLRHDVAYGATLKKVPNPYRWQVRVLSGVGPIQSIVSQHFDFAPIGSFYSGFFSSVSNLGDRPQATALVPPLSAPAPGWGANSRLSGCAHVGLNFLFDRDGERFAAGLPVYTALCEGEKVYDPRLDSTYPGGSGSCRAGVEGTYVYSRNPALHALTYALGRFQNDTRVFGLGQPVDTIDLAAIVDWANDCDANEWTVNMVLQEGGTGANLREQRVRNLDDLCAAGGGRWYQAGGLLSFDWHRPRLALATLTDDDILDAGGGTDAVPTVRDRMNGVRPQYISPAHNWQQITAAEIVGTTYRTEDGEKLTQVYPLNGVTNAAQAGELASYAMADSREIGPIDVQAKVNWRFYRPGDCIEIDSSLLAYQGQAVVNQRSLNPQALSVALQLKSETPGKHDFALGKVAAPPPTPVLAQTPEEKDTLAAAALAPRGVDVADLVAPANANRVPFSRMEANRGWELESNPSGLSAPVDYDEVDGFRFFRALVTATASGQTVGIGQGPEGLFRITPGERLSVQARVGCSDPGAASSVLSLFAISGDGSQVEQIGFGLNSTPSIIQSNLTQFFATVPSWAAFGAVSVFGTSGGAGLMAVVISEPMVTSAAADQTSHPPYSPGPNASDGADPNNLITIDDGILNGIGTGNIVVDNNRVPLGANSVVNSDFTRGKFGWRWRGGGFESDWGVNLTGSPNWFGQRNVMWATFPGTPTSGNFFDLSPDAIWAGAPTANALTLAMPVVSGDRLFASVLAAPHRCTFQLWILQFDSAFTLVGADQVTGGTNLGGANGDPANFTRISRFSTATSTARWAIPMMRMLATGETDPYIFFTEPMLSKVAAGQVVAPPYVPGRADPNADVTAISQRSIVPQFPVIEIKQGEAGNVGNRTVTHEARRGTETLTGGTWSKPSQDLGSATVSINSSTGLATISGVDISGRYNVRYTHTDGIATEEDVNVTYMPASAPAAGPTASGVIRDFNTTSFAAVTNNLTITLPSGVTQASLITGNVVLEALALPEGDSVCEMEWQRETSPGTWADVGTVATSSPNPGVNDVGGFPDPYAGAISCNRTATGLTAGSTQTFRLVARISGGITRPIFPFGTATAGG